MKDVHLLPSLSDRVLLRDHLLFTYIKNEETRASSNARTPDASGPTPTAPLHVRTTGSGDVTKSIISGWQQVQISIFSIKAGGYKMKIQVAIC